MDTVVVRDVIKTFPGKRIKPFNIFHPFAKEKIYALRGVSFNVKGKRVTSILGPNGAGKTTLIKILCGLLVPTAGEAIVEGYSVTENASEIRDITTYVPSDERSFYWRLTVYENLDFFGRIYGLSGLRLKEKIKEVLEVVDLWDRRDERYNMLSGGLKQRLSIARGLLKEPRVMLMDEPTKGLDPAVSKDIRTFVREHLVKKEGITVIWASHDMYEVEEISDTVIILNKGKIVKIGEIDILKAMFPKRILILQMTSKTPHNIIKIKNQLSSMDGVTVLNLVKKRDIYLLRIEYSQKKLQIKDLLKHIISDPYVDLIDLQSHTMSLEDVFLRVVKDGKAQ